MNELTSVFSCLTSGDPLADSVVLMSRLEAEKWLAGHSSDPISSASITVPVTWEIAVDPQFSQIIDQGVVDASADHNWTVKVVADGLSADTNYYYRFRHGSGTMAAVSATGQTKTLPTDPKDVHLAVLSCANFTAEEAFLAYGRVLEMHQQDPYDAILFLGDYIYEYGEGGYENAEDAKDSRGFIPDRDVVSLDDYRARYQQYNSDPNLTALRAAAPWISIWDDHETANDSWKDGAENHDPATQGSWQERVNAAMQAYYEVMPIREPWLRTGTDQAPEGTSLIQGYRSFDFGSLLSLHVLETRLTARDKQLAYPTADDVKARIGAILSDPTLSAAYAQALGLTPPTGADDLAGINAFSQALINPVQQELVVATVTAMLGDPERDLIGDQQMAWLQNEMATSPATWQLLGQQVLMQNMSLPAELLLNAGDASILTQYALPLQKLNAGMAFEDLSDEEQARFSDLTKVPYNPDAWDGYGVERETILQTALQLGKSLVSLAGDTHNAWAGTLHTMAAGVTPAGSQAGVELATPGVTSPGFEKYLPGVDALIRQNLPAVDGLGDLFTSYVNNLDFADLSHRGFLDVSVTADAITGRYELLNQSPLLEEPVWAQRSVSYGIDGSQRLTSAGVQRFYNPVTGLHHFTSDALESALVDQVLGWQAEGEALSWFPNGEESGTLQHLYRLYAPTTGDHLFTLSKSEMQTALQAFGYVLEGIAGRALTESSNSSKPVYRFYKPETGAHFYTNSVEEANTVIARSLGDGYDLDNAVGADNLLSNGWGYQLEGIAFHTA